jgi:Sec-independent protein translocase protein TatA
VGDWTWLTKIGPWGLVIVLGTAFVVALGTGRLILPWYVSHLEKTIDDYQDLLKTEQANVQALKELYQRDRAELHQTMVELRLVLDQMRRNHEDSHG